MTDSILDEFDAPPRQYKRKKLRKLMRNAQFGFAAARERSQKRPRWKKQLIVERAARTRKA